MGVRVKLHGGKVKFRQRRGARKGLKAALEHLLGVSNELVPLEEGTLQRSGKVTVARVKLEGAVSYDTVYARRQHEELTWRHAPGRQAKYLEQPANTEAPVMVELIAAGIRRELQEGREGRR